MNEIDNGNNVLIYSGSLLKRETNIPGNQPEIEHYRFTTNGNLQAYMYENLLYVHYGYNDANTRTYKYSFDLSPNWVNGRLESVNFNLHTAMFYPNAYINFNNNGYYTKHYYNGMERIASRLGDQNLPISTHDPELQDRKWQLDSNIRRNIVDITGYEFLPVGEEQNPEDPKPVFELPVIGLNNLQPSADGIFYYHPNHLGSTCYVTDGNASVVQGFLYAPFGEITNEHNSGWQSGTLPKYSFNAKELDEETGMYYYEARYMAPPVFISRDPLFEKYPTFSPYAYCANNPVKYVDPDGREYGNFYDENGKLIGTDGSYDNKHYVIRNGQNYLFSFIGRWRAKWFVRKNSGNAEAFQNKPSIYEKFVKIVPISMLNEAYNSILDDGRGGEAPNNNTEYGGYANEAGTAWEKTGVTSKVGDPSVEKYLLLPGLMPNRIKFHSHGSGFKIEGREPMVNKNPSTSTTFREGEVGKTHYWEQPPSEKYDIQNAGNTTNYVFGMRDRNMYVYTRKGVQAKISIDGLLKNAR